MQEKKTEKELEEHIQELEEHVKELEKQYKGNSNREYKSRLFSFIFGREENKRWTLSLYNAIHDTSHDNLSDITINTIEDIVYMGMKNDLSILVSETVSLYKSMDLYEQQSSYNPNMPIREFMYAGKLYDKFIYLAKLNRYSKKLIPLPLPKLVTFYNGTDEKEDEVVLLLSDAFKEEIRQNIIHRYNESKEKPDAAAISAEVDQIFQEANPDIEVRVRMININYGHNRKVLSACKPLEEYAWFVSQVRENLIDNKYNKEKKLLGIEDAVDKAINKMPDDFEIKNFMVANRAEVKDMCLTEYDEEETMQMFREEGREEGVITAIKNLMESMRWTKEQAMEALKISETEKALYSGMLEK